MLYFRKQARTEPPQSPSGKASAPLELPRQLRLYSCSWQKMRKVLREKDLDKTGLVW
jgi:hypothetical protein